MQFSIKRETLLKPLQLASGVVEKKQTLPMLSNVLMVLDGDQLSLTGTDLEVEWVGRVTNAGTDQQAEVTVSARKLLDICQSLPEEATIAVTLQDDKLLLKSERSRFLLATLPAEEFPQVEELPDTFSLTIEQAQLRDLLEATSFAMAQQDVRYYLNGMLFEVASEYLRVVATDGHRLAMATIAMSNTVEETQQLILPRKGVMELLRLLQDDEGEVKLTFGQNHLRAEVPEHTLSSKLIEGKFPDYNRVIPKGGERVMVGDCQQLRQAFARAAILVNEQYYGVRLTLSENELKILASNPEQEEAEAIVTVEYGSEPMEIGFNVKYLMDILAAIKGKQTKMTLSDPGTSALLETDDDSNALYVVMPMRL